MKGILTVDDLNLPEDFVFSECSLEIVGDICTLCIDFGDD